MTMENDDIEAVVIDVSGDETSVTVIDENGNAETVETEAETEVEIEAVETVTEAAVEIAEIEATVDLARIESAETIALAEIEARTNGDEKSWLEMQVETLLIQVGSLEEKLALLVDRLLTPLPLPETVTIVEAEAVTIVEPESESADALQAVESQEPPKPVRRIVAI